MTPITSEPAHPDGPMPGGPPPGGPIPGEPPWMGDPGLQTERTHLAWQRTGLAFVGVGALLLYGVRSSGPIIAAVAGLGLLFGVLLVATAHGRYRAAVAAVRADQSPVAPGGLAVVALTATALGLAGLGAMIGAP